MTYVIRFELPGIEPVRDLEVSVYHSGILTVRIGMEPEHQVAPQAIPVETV
jgi:HSP20 family molecular chaperone IbpA